MRRASRSRITSPDERPSRLRLGGQAAAKSRRAQARVLPGEFRISVNPQIGTQTGGAANKR